MRLNGANLAFLLTGLAWVSTARAAAPSPATQPLTRSNHEEYRAHVEKLRDELPESFTIVIQKPFVVIGDERPEMVRRRARDTVGWAVERLKRAYFARDPEQILNIWLFKDADSYNTHAEELFGEKPTTPYGYYSPRDRALVMNISTGGGTLVHEIVHPFIEANFPACPSWFNEGLGSLYEQSAERDGEIVGLTNWRLKGLQDALRDGRTLSFADLTALNTAEFYGDESGRNYSQARYLCYYLQERKLLRTFYERFVKCSASDPTGYETLKRVLDEDLADAERDWKRFVLGLRFP